MSTRITSESKQSYQVDQSFGAGFIIIIPCEKLKVTEEIQSHFLDIRNNKLVLFTLVYQDFG